MFEIERKSLLELDQGAGHFDRHPQRLNNHKVPADLSKFWVVTVLSNPIRYKRRYELYWDFAEVCQNAGIKLVTVEQAFGDRQFMVTEANNPYHLQVRTVEELWHKENMINLGVRHACAIAPNQVREVAWVDCDCRPARPYRDWFEETWQQLQHYEFVQMWETLIDLDTTYNIIGVPQPGFMSNYIKFGTPNPIEFKNIQDQSSRYPYGSKAFGRPGLAWAANIDAFNKVGGLIDFAILGAGDWYMAHALVGSLNVATGDYNGTRYVEKMMQWQELCERWIKRDVGFVYGVVYHDFHGKKIDRQYGTRGKILHNCQFNPDTDIKYDSQGLLQLETWEPRQIKMRNQIREYFRARDEDSIDL